MLKRAPVSPPGVMLISPDTPFQSRPICDITSGVVPFCWLLMANHQIEKGDLLVCCQTGLAQLLSLSLFNLTERMAYIHNVS